MRYLTLGEVVDLHRAVIETTGGASGIRDLGALESALCSSFAKNTCPPKYRPKLALALVEAALIAPPTSIRAGNSSHTS